jgi:predicted RNA-binding protein with PUA-like domain
MPNRWLFKTEPEAYSFARLAAEKTARWDGVTNALALKHLRAIRKGDAILIYHTGSERAVVGIARATSDPYADPRADDPRIVVVDVEADRALAKPVTLDAIKKNALFAQFELVRIGRLGVMPVPEPLWKEILRMAGG